MDEEARYLYSIARTSLHEDLGRIGINDSLVYTLPHKDIAAVVHSCRQVLYKTGDEKHAGEWILEHSYVIDQTTKRFGTVLPFSFDVIIRGGNEAVLSWLETNYNLLNRELSRVLGKAEYSVQIFYDHELLAREAISRHQELNTLDEQLKTAGIGKAYLLKRNLDIKLKDIVSQEAFEMAEEFGRMIKPLADEIKIENNVVQLPEIHKRWKLMRAFICLVREENIARLGNILDEINSKKGMAVRFTGPWAPFSFVNLVDAV